MNENAGTTKLLVINHRTDAETSIAVRLGTRSSGVAIVDRTTPEKLVLFQITYTEDGGRHSETLLDFLASGEEKDTIGRVFVNRVTSEYAVRFPELQDRTVVINYAQLVPRSAQLLGYIASDSREQILYDDDADGSAGRDNWASDTCALINSSSESGSYVTKIIKAKASATRPLSESTHTVLTGARTALVGLLSDSQLAEGFHDEDTIDNQLTNLLHTLPLSKMSDAFQSRFTEAVKPAVQAYAEAIKSEFSGAESGDGGGTVIISDCLFNSEFCRRMLMAEQLSGSKQTMRFIKDPGLLGFMAALLIGVDESPKN